MKDSRIGMELRALNNCIMRHIENHMQRGGIDRVTATNGWIISYLADNQNRDIYQKDLEERFTITRSTASKVINLMEKKGLVQRQSVPHDARLKKLVLTPRALALSEEMSRDRLFLEATLTGGFTDEEVLQLTGYLERMKRNIRALSQ